MNHRYKKHRHEVGSSNPYLIATIVLVVLFVGAGSFAIWSFVNYNEQKSNVDAKVSLAVAEAKRVQVEEDERKFAEREKQPNRVFVGPEDYGRLTFSYPKTWSTYVDRDASKGGAYQAYLHRDVVPPVSSVQQYMLRVSIEDKNYDNVIRTYEGRVEKGQLRSSTASFNGHTAARFDGDLTNNIRGAAVVFKVRDKTVTLQTDADQFKSDFDALVETINFNQ